MLLESGIRVYRVAVAVVTAVQDLDTATRYLTKTERTPTPTFKWQYYLAHTAKFVVFFSVWNVRKLIIHVRDVTPHLCEHCVVDSLNITLPTNALIVCHLF